MKDDGNRVKSLQKNHQETCEQLHRNISSLLLDVQHYSEAHEASRRYHDLMLVPLIRGAALLAEMMGEANVKFSEEYLLAVDQNDITVEELEEQIDQWDRLILRVQKKLKELAVSSLDPLSKAFQISKCTTLLGLYGSMKRELKHELEQIGTSNESSSVIIQEIDHLNQLIDQGYKMADASCDKIRGEFIEPVPEKLSWIIEIEALEQRWLKKHQSKKYLLDPFDNQE